MFFGVSLITWLKRDIIHILDEETDYISSTKLTNLISYASHSSIRKACRELQADIEKTYTTDQVELITNKHHGMKLIRHTMNVQSLIEDIMSIELVYEIIQNIAKHRILSTLSFCRTYHISESQLRRKTEELNTYLKPYKLRVTISNHIKLIGKEYTIRVFHFFFLFLCHRQFSKIPWIKNKDLYLEKAKKTAAYLNLNIWENQLEILSIVIYVNQKALDQDYLIGTYKDLIIITWLDIPERPDFMLNWPVEDWKFMLLFLYSLDSYHLNLNFSLTKMQIIQPPHHSLRWITIFEKHFLKLNDAQKFFVYEKFLKQMIFTSIFEFYENFLDMYHSNTIKNLKKLYPLYLENFDAFWDDFSANSNRFATAHFKIESFFTCIYLAPFNLCFQQIKMFVFTDMTILYTNYIQERIQAFFLNNYKIIFTENYNDADIIVGTIDFLANDLQENIEVVMINIVISNNDLKKIDSTIKMVLERKRMLVSK